MSSRSQLTPNQQHVLALLADPHSPAFIRHVRQPAAQDRYYVYVANRRRMTLDRRSFRVLLDRKLIELCLQGSEWDMYEITDKGWEQAKERL